MLGITYETESALHKSRDVNKAKIQDLSLSLSLSVCVLCSLSHGTPKLLIYHFGKTPNCKMEERDRETERDREKSN